MNVHAHAHENTEYASSGMAVIVNLRIQSRYGMLSHITRNAHTNYFRFIIMSLLCVSQYSGYNFAIHRDLYLTRLYGAICILIRLEIVCLLLKISFLRHLQCRKNKCIQIIIIGYKTYR